jgi:hypothetical protein
LSDLLLANRQGNLRQQAAVLDGHHSADELISPADFSKPIPCLDSMSPRSSF